MYASNYFESKMLGLLLGGSNGIEPPANLYLALFASSPGDSGAAGTEISYTGYERQEIFFTDPEVTTSGMSFENTAVITFPEAPSSAGTVQSVAVFDNLQNMWLYGNLTTQLNIQAGVSPVFQAGSLKWTWSGNLSTYYRQAIMNVLAGESAAQRSSLGAFNPYIALYSGNPLSGGAELTGNAYARFAVAFQQSQDQPTSGALKYENAAEIVSPTAGPGGWAGPSGGALTHIAIMDSSSGGNIFAGMPVRNNTSYLMTYGSVVGFHQGDLTFSIN